MNEPRCEVRVAVSPHSRSSSSSAPPSSSTTPATTTPRLTVLLRSHDQDPHCSPWTPASNGGGRMNTRLRSRNQYDAGSASSGTCHVRRNSSRTDSNHPLHYERPEDSAVHHQTKQRRQQFPRTIPELLRHQGGLVSIPQPVLAQCLDPVMRALQELDAMALLNLQTSDHGPCVANGTCVQAIHHQVSPPVHTGPPNRNGSSSPVVRYIHLAEVPNEYSMGIFVFPPHAKIPLHDHPGMCVLSRVLYGDLERLSLDLVVVDEETPVSDAPPHTSQHCPPIPPHYPKGTQRARHRHKDYLQAPMVTVLYPVEGNLHEFCAGPHGAAVLDVLLPPYNSSRDCTFYHAHAAVEQDKGLYWIVPTGQPEDFHCISGQYRDIGSL